MTNHGAAAPIKSGRSSFPRARPAATSTPTWDGLRTMMDTADDRLAKLRAWMDLRDRAREAMFNANDLEGVSDAELTELGELLDRVSAARIEYHRCRGLPTT